MNLSTIEMSRDEAEAALLEWGEAAKAAKCTEEDRAIAAGYEALARGHKLIALPDTVRAGGLDECLRPRLAIAPATALLTYLLHTNRGSVAFSTSDQARTQMWDWDLPVANGRVLLRDLFPPHQGWDWRLNRFGWKAMVPVVPPRFRTSGWKSCHILFEAEWAEHTPPAPVDPALIKHLRGDLWVVRGLWDLTALERAVLLERNRA